MLATRLFGKPIRIRYYHDGYEPAVIQDKQKLERNITLLEEMIEEEPDNPTWWGFLGRETLATCAVDSALDILIEAEKRANATLWYGRTLDIQLLLLKIYISKNNSDEAESVCLRMLDKQADFPDALYWLGRIKMFRARQHLHQAQLQFKQTKDGFHTYRGTVSADHQILAFKVDQELASIQSTLQPAPPKRE